MVEMDSKKLKLDDDDDDGTQKDGYYCSSSSSCYIPECIISHILSFLPIEDSVKASFVSKSWKSLLSSSPLSILNLDFERFSKNSRLNDQPNRFAQFVEHIMLLHKKGPRHLEQLRLAFDISGFEKDDDPQIDKWVNFAMTSDSAILDLDFWGGRKEERYPYHDNRYYTLPECTTLPLQSVEILRLKFCRFIIPSRDMIFESIKILVLTAVILPGYSVHNLIESCPCLEELHLIKCIVSQYFTIEDLETKLKCLVVDSCNGDSYMSSFDIDIPSLLRLKYVGNMIFDFSIGRNLTEAEIKFNDDYWDECATEEEAAEDDAEYCAMLHQVLSSMDNLETLTISKSCLQVLTFDYDKTIEALIDGDESEALIDGDESDKKLPPPLPNLKHLSLKSFEGRNYTMNLACLLKSSPNLETLCIDQSMDNLIEFGTACLCCTETENSKKKKLKNETQDCCSSSCYIPECIVSHILSFLPTEDRVRASFVSNTWKPLLFPLSVIDLDFDRFSTNSPLNDQKKRFAQFVQCIMLLHKKGPRHLKELRLAFDVFGFIKDDPQIDEWVSFAMTIDSATLDLDFWGGREGGRYPCRDDNHYTLPECNLPPLQSVEVLRLKYCIFIPPQGTVFMSIKILVLTAVSLPDNSVEDLIESCPYLEELHLIACIVPEDFVIEDLETELKCLVFDSCKGGSIMYSFRIDIPSLLRFKYVGAMMSIFHIENSRNLSEAEIIFDDDYCDYSATDEEAAEDDARYCEMIHELLSKMDNLESLTISKSSLQVLTFEYDKTMEALIARDESSEKLPPTLPNLKHLSVKSFEDRNYTMNLACLLRSSPNLETLCIDQSMDELISPSVGAGLFDDAEEMFWRMYLFPSEFLRKIKKVEIKGFEGRIDEMFLLKILLDHSLVLEEMIIYKAAMQSRYASMKQDGNQKMKVKQLKVHQQVAIEKVLSFRRGSSRARILLM